MSRADQFLEDTAMRAVLATAVPYGMSFGTVKSYDPTTDTVMVSVYQGSDAPPQEWGPMPVGRDHALDGSGDQSWISEGAAVVVQTIQAANQLIEKNGDCSVALRTHFNGPNQPPFPNLTPGSFGRKTVGGHFYLFDDGGQVASVVSSGGHTFKLDDGNKIASIVTAGGHTIAGDDLNKLVKIISAGGHTVHLDDGNQILSFLSAGGHTVHLDDVNQLVSIVSKAGAQLVANDLTGQLSLLSHTGAQSVVLDAVAQAISHVAAHIGLGATWGSASLGTGRAGISNDDVTTFASTINSALKTAFGAFAATMAGSSIPNAAQFTALITGSWLANASNIPVPSAPAGSSTIRFTA